VVEYIIAIAKKIIVVTKTITLSSINGCNKKRDDIIDFSFTF
jgi:hypothetical protein